MKFPIFSELDNIPRYLQKKSRQNLLGGTLVFIAAAAASVPGLIHLASSVLTDGFAQATVDKLVADMAASGLLLLPAILLFSISYLLYEGHSLGWKSALGICGVTITLAVTQPLDAQLTIVLALVGILSAIAAVVAIGYQRNAKDKQRDSPAVTENVVKFGLRISGFICVLILVGMIVYLGIRATAYISLEFVTSRDWGFSWAAQVIQGKASGSLGGVLDFAVGSLLLASVCEVIAIPLGVGAAIYLSEYAAKNWLTSTIRYFIETLAGIPSVVIALVGAAIFVIALDLGYTLIGAGVSLAFMILPFNIRIAEEAMRSVPQGYREAAFALGATKWQTTRKTVLFAALPGIITGVLLGFGEALGETIVIALTAGWSPPTNLDLSGQVISNFTILPSAENLFATHQIFPSLSIFVWQATDLLRFGTGSSNLYFLQTGIVLTAAFYLVMIYLAICSTALIARNYLSKKIKGK